MLQLAPGSLAHACDWSGQQKPLITSILWLTIPWGKGTLTQHFQTVAVLTGNPFPQHLRVFWSIWIPLQTTVTSCGDSKGFSLRASWCPSCRCWQDQGLSAQQLWGPALLEADRGAGWTLHIVTQIERVLVKLVMSEMCPHLPADCYSSARVRCQWWSCSGCSLPHSACLSPSPLPCLSLLSHHLTLADPLLPSCS